MLGNHKLPWKYAQTDPSTVSNQIKAGLDDLIPGATKIMLKIEETTQNFGSAFLLSSPPEPEVSCQELGFALFPGHGFLMFYA